MRFICDNVPKIHTLVGGGVIPAREAVAGYLSIRTSMHMCIDKNPPKLAN